MSFPLIAFDQQAPAHLLVSYLVSVNIAAQMQSNDNEYIVVVLEQKDVSNAQSIAEHFIQHPNDEKYQQAVWQHGDSNTAGIGKRLFPQVDWRERITSAPFTTLVFVLCSVIYVLSNLGLFNPILHYMLMQPLPELAQNHQWWRLLGPAFIHFSVLHIVFNLLWWSTLGSSIERTMGVSMLIIVFTVSAIASNVAQALVSTPVSNFNLYLFGGLSGVVYAAMGFVWWLGWLKPQWGLSIQKPIVGFMLVWLAFGFTGVMNVANAAHLVGLISGCLMAAALSVFADRRR